MKNYKNILSKTPIALIVLIIVLIIYYFGISRHIYNNLGYEYGITLDIIVTSLIVAFMSAYVCLMINSKNNLNNTNKIKWLEDKLKVWNNISYRVRDAGDVVFNNLPIGIILYNNEYEIEWANKFAKNSFSNVLQERKIKTINNNIYENIVQNNAGFVEEVYDKKYDFLNLIGEKVLYFFDVTARESIMSNYESKISSIAYLQLDNYEAAVGKLDAQDRAGILSKYLSEISEWAQDFNLSVQGFAESKFIVFMNKSQLTVLEGEQFSIVDRIRNVSYENQLLISLSIGISCDDKSTQELSEIAQGALDVAISRGGDQVVSIVSGDTNYYGGKINSVAKKDKIRARVISEELSALIEKSSNVIIMGHMFPDTDAIGACLGVARLCKASNVEMDIVIDEKKLEKTVSKIMDLSKRENFAIMSDFIDPKDAINKISDDTLLIVVDCHKKEITIDSKIVSKATNVVVIDHHRRSDSVIEGALIFYVEPYASSSVELVTEIIQFYPKDVILSHYEATLMLAGLIVDTNNFTYRTSSRSFETAAYLKSAGADTVKIKAILREDFDEYKSMNDILSNLYIYEDVFSIVAVDEDSLIDRTTLAKIADNALTINDVQASFALGYLDSKTVGIAARSYGDSNVQLIMEKMGGGGHLNNAATQIKDKSLEEANEMLQGILDKLGEKSETMKVILLLEIKGKGKEGDIIEVASGYGNFLLSSKQAVEATPSNIKNIEEQNTKEEEEQKKLLNEMVRVKEKLESQMVELKIKLGKNGKSFGKISSKQIVDAYEKNFDIRLDRKKIILNDLIDSLGIHKVVVQLHKEVKAELKIQVIEE